MNRLTTLLASALSCLAVLLVFAPAPALAQPPLAVCGDCDGDFDVDVVDARIAWLTSMPVGQCDVDLDTDVDLADAMAIARFSAGLGGFLWCTQAIPSVSRVEPFSNASGNCFNGVSSGAPFRFQLFTGGPFADSGWVSSPGIPAGSSAFTIASQFNQLVPAPYSAAVIGGSCVVFLDPAGNQAHLQLRAATGAICYPDLGQACINMF